MSEIKELLEQLMKREITPYECLNKLPSYLGNDLEKLIYLNQIPIKVRRGLTLKDINTMNYLEVKEYCKDKLSKGINLKDLGMELDIMWEDGLISGFDYRYFKESAKIKISKEFINFAKNIGRYDK